MQRINSDLKVMQAISNAMEGNTGGPFPCMGS